MSTFWSKVLGDTRSVDTATEESLLRLQTIGNLVTVVELFHLRIRGKLKLQIACSNHCDLEDTITEVQGSFQLDCLVIQSSGI